MFVSATVSDSPFEKVCPCRFGTGLLTVLCLFLKILQLYKPFAYVPTLAHIITFIIIFKLSKTCQIHK